MTGSDSFDEKMADADWEEVYARQAARSGDLAARFCELLDLEPGDDVLELGSGPGYTTERLAEHVSPGTVYAIDRQAGALRHLRETVDPTAQIQPVCGDLTAPPVRFTDPIAAVAAFVLHHTAPEAALAGVAAILPAGSPVLVVEYHPDAAGSVGPPLDRRLPPEGVGKWLDEVGFVRQELISLPEEKYAIVARRDNTENQRRRRNRANFSP